MRKEATEKRATPDYPSIRKFTNRRQTCRLIKPLPTLRRTPQIGPVAE